MADYKFKAFISYRHGELDGAVAARLQRTLERFHIPGAIARRTGHKKVGRIFRDVEELASSSDLFTQLEQNIIDSEFLIVICSPRSRDAVWVHKEIETFLKYHDREHILAVLIKGEPNEAFPPQLMEEGEPLAFDLRSPTTRGSLSLCKKNLPRLVAPLIGCSYDDIYNRTRIYRLQRLTAASALLMAASLAVGIALWRKNVEITQNYTAKLENQSRYLANTSSELLGSGDRESALLVALSALPTEEDTRPYVAEARIALADALYLYQKDEYYVFRPVKKLEHGAALKNVSAGSAQEKLILSIDSGYEVYVWDSETLELKWKLDTPADGVFYERAMFPGNGTVLLYNNDRLDCFDMTGSEPLWSFVYPLCGAYHSESFLASPEMKCTIDRETGKVYLSPAYWNVEKNEEGRPDIPAAHCGYIIDVKDGSAKTWRPESWYIGKSTDDNGFGRDVLLSADGTLCGVAVQQSAGNDRYSTDFLVFHAGEETAVFHATIEDGAGYASIVSINDGMAAVAVADSYPVFHLSGNYDVLRFTLYVYDIASGDLLYSHSDSASYSTLEINGGCYSLKKGSTFILRCGNLVLSLDAATGEVLQRIESESEQIGLAVYGGGLGIQFHSDGTVQIRGLTSQYFPTELYSAYHRDLDIDRPVRAFTSNRRFFVYAENYIYCYECADDSSFLYETDTAFTRGAFSPSGGLYAMVSASKKLISVVRCETGEELFRDEYMTKSTSDESMYLWVDDTTLAYIPPEGTAVRLYNAEDGSVREVALTPPSDYSEPQLSPTAGGGLFAVFYSSNFSWKYDETRTQREIVQVIDSAGGSILRSFTVGDIFARYTERDSNNEGEVFSAAISQSGRYVLIPNMLSVGEEETADITVGIYDLQADAFVPLSDDITEIRRSSALFLSNGWISPTEDVFLLMETENEFTVVNAADGRVLQHHTVENLDGNELSFSADGQSVLYQDTAMYLHSYNRAKDAEVWKSRSSIGGWATFEFAEDGRYMVVQKKISLSTPSCILFEKKGDGYEQIDTLSFCSATDGRYVIISNGSSFTRVYRYLSLDEMIARAREVLNGRELTELEKQTYLVG